MGWFGGSAPSKVSVVSEVREEPKQQQFLEDLPPKFEDKEPVKRREPTLIDAAKQIHISDFSVERFVGMPCFREAMITGFQAMGVLGVVTFLIHKNVNRSLNWSVCGFFLGNVVGWEQCRSLRRRSFQMMEKARKAKEERNLKKIEEGNIEGDDSFKKFQEFNNKDK
ncbi:cytochrome oxidase, 20 [Scheffersomyces xylosifermentans]|uniref:cytochrome oxidase, 20 n=1 Tax=Scheffersomyces xylosifermentans TaxID=1304137 RepID=UPI00315D5A9F